MRNNNQNNDNNLNRIKIINNNRPSIFSDFYYLRGLSVAPPPPRQKKKRQSHSFSSLNLRHNPLTRTNLKRIIKKRKRRKKKKETRKKKNIIYKLAFFLCFVFFFFLLFFHTFPTYSFASMVGQILLWPLQCVFFSKTREIFFL